MEIQMVNCWCVLLNSVRINGQLSQKTAQASSAHAKKFAEQDERQGSRKGFASTKQ